MGEAKRKEKGRRRPFLFREERREDDAGDTKKDIFLGAGEKIWVRAKKFGENVRKKGFSPVRDSPSPCNFFEE